MFITKLNWYNLILLFTKKIDDDNRYGKTENLY